MSEQTKKGIRLSLILLGIFVIYTLCVRFVDVEPIGPEDSMVGFAALNGTIWNAIGEHEAFYLISEICGVLALVTPVLFGFIALLQIIKRKGLFKADQDLYILGVFYALVGIAYVFFEIVIINYRPVIQDEGLEASYPSSHAMLGMCLFVSAALQFRSRLKDKSIKNIAYIGCIILAVVTVLCRFISGVHWFTDIIGGVLLSLLLVVIYVTMLSYMKSYKKTKKIKDN